MLAGTPTRASLLGRLHDGADPMAWNDFFERYWPLVFSIARHRGCSRNTAEDVVQDVMLAVFERKAVFRHDPSRGRFRDWLGGVVRRKVTARRCAGRTVPRPWRQRKPVARARGARRRARLGLGSGLRSGHAGALDVVRREMSPGTYQAFEVFRVGECSGVEAARITGLTRNAVYQARKKVLRRLRELGAEYGDRGPPDEAIAPHSACVPKSPVERSRLTRIEQTRPVAPGDDPSERIAAT